jgi:UDP-glucose 4-epimerase
MEKVVVTGGAGFIGHHLVNRLLEDGFAVSVIDNLSSGKEENLNSKAQFFKADIRDEGELEKIFAGAKYIFHLAAIPSVQYSIEHPEETNDINLGGTLKVFHAAKKAGVKRVIYSSSSAIYGDAKIMPISENSEIHPKSPYALHKYAGELYARLFAEIYGLEVVCLRYFNVFGEGQSSTGAYASVIAKFLEFTKDKKPLSIFGDGNQTRDFVHVSDIVTANILAAKSDRVGKGEGINIGSGTKYSVNAIAKIFGGAISYLPPRIEPKDSLADIALAEFLLGWKPKADFKTALTELLQNQEK